MSQYVGTDVGATLSVSGSLGNSNQVAARSAILLSTFGGIWSVVMVFTILLLWLYRRRLQHNKASPTRSITAAVRGGRRKVSDDPELGNGVATQEEHHPSSLPSIKDQGREYLRLAIPSIFDSSQSFLRRMGDQLLSSFSASFDWNGSWWTATRVFSLCHVGRIINRAYGRSAFISFIL